MISVLLNLSVLDQNFWIVSISLIIAFWKKIILNDLPICSDKFDGVFDDLRFGPIGVARFSGSGQVRGEPIKKRIEAKATILLPDFELRSTEK
jgi:hypothetical protein